MKTCETRAAVTARRLIHGLLTVLLCAFSGAGCLELPRENSPITYWTLAPTVVPDADSASASSSGDGPRGTLVVGPIGLPGYLTRAEVVHRAGDHQLVVERFDHWAGSLEEQVPRVLSQDIMALDPSVFVEPYPGLGHESPDVRLLVTVLAFELDAAGDLQLHVEWMLAPLLGHGEATRRVTRLTESAGDRSVGAIVAAMSRALGGLAREVVAAFPSR